jgi:hypothetical protein
VIERTNIAVISGGGMDWSATISLCVEPEPSWSVCYQGDSNGGDSEVIGIVTAIEAIRDFGRVLLSLPEEYVFGGPVSIEGAELDQWQRKYLELCCQWSEGGDASNDVIALASLLSCFSSNEVAHIYSISEGFRSAYLGVVANKVKAIYGSFPQETNFFEDVTEQLGGEISAEWFERLNALLDQEADSSKNEIEAAAGRVREEILQRFGSPEEIDGFVGLIERYGAGIPPGYLSHATLFPQPKSWASKRSLLIAWGVCEEPLPALPEAIVPVPKINRNLDVEFLRWICDGKESELVRRAFECNDGDTRALFSKLWKFVRDTQFELERLSNETPSGQAHFIGLQIKKRDAEYLATILPKELIGRYRRHDIDRKPIIEGQELFSSEARRVGHAVLNDRLVGKRYVVLCEMVELDYDGLFNRLEDVRGFSIMEDASRWIAQEKAALADSVCGRYPNASESAPRPEQRDLVYFPEAPGVSLTSCDSHRLGDRDQLYARTYFWDVLDLDPTADPVMLLYQAYAKSRDLGRLLERIGLAVSGFPIEEYRDLGSL